MKYLLDKEELDQLVTLSKLADAEAEKNDA